MAQIPKGILGVFKGDLGGMKGVIVKGKASIITPEFDTKYDFTPKQQLSHDKFGLISQFAKSIRFSIIEPFWIPYKKSISKFQSFMHYNANLVLDTLVIDYCNLQVVRSTIITPFVPESLFAPLAGIILYGFQSQDQLPFPVQDSIFYQLLINLETNKSFFNEIQPITIGSFIIVRFPPQSSNKGFLIYNWWSNKTNRKFSKSLLAIRSFVFDCP